MNIAGFKVYDHDMEQEADMRCLVGCGEWVAHIDYSENPVFAVTEDGDLLIVDQKGGVARCDPTRFSITQIEFKPFNCSQGESGGE
jgi:hypothetical protein